MDFIDSASVLKCTTPFYFWCFVFRVQKELQVKLHTSRLHSLEKAADSLTYLQQNLSGTACMSIDLAPGSTGNCRKKDSKKSPKKKHSASAVKVAFHFKKHLQKRSQRELTEGKGKPACRVH